MQTVLTRTASFAVAALLSLSAPAIGAQQAFVRGELAEASKIVVVGGSLAEIVYALEMQDKVVARDSTSLYPQEVQELPDVGYIRRLTPEGVLSTGLDGLLALEGSGPPETMTVLDKAGIPTVIVPEGYSAEGVLRKVEIVGQALGAEDKAEALKARLKMQLADADRFAAGHTSDLSVLFVLSMQGGNVMAAGNHTAADGILKLAHLKNAMSGFAGYKQVSAEAITEAAPDVILMMNNGGRHAAKLETVLSNPALADTPAAKSERVISMDGLYLLGFGPRTAEAVKELSARVADYAAEGAGQ